MSRALELALAFPGTTLEQMALVVAREFHPSIDVAAELEVLDALAEPLARESFDRRDPLASALALAEHVGVRLGIVGDTARYDDPESSFLPSVRARRTGLPITISVLYVALGRRVGVHVDGIGFPGHFLVRVGGAEGVLQDPFHGGRCLDADDLQHLLVRVAGPDARVRPEQLAPVDTRALAMRMLVNLRGAYTKSGDRARAFTAADLLCAIEPHPVHRRARGELAMRLGAYGIAVRDLEAYVKVFPTGRDARAVRDLLERARSLAGPHVAPD